MRLTILRMIAAGSLSAFSAGVSTLPLVREPGGQTGRSPGSSGTPTRSSPAGRQVRQWDGTPPGRILPRGSLLDLTV